MQNKNTLDINNTCAIKSFNVSILSIIRSQMLCIYLKKHFEHTFKCRWICNFFTSIAKSKTRFNAHFSDEWLITRAVLHVSLLSSSIICLTADSQVQPCCQSFPIRDDIHSSNLRHNLIVQADISERTLRASAIKKAILVIIFVTRI